MFESGGPKGSPVIFGCQAPVTGTLFSILRRKLILLWNQTWMPLQRLMLPGTWWVLFPWDPPRQSRRRASGRSFPEVSASWSPLDADEAGGKAFSWWKKNFPQAQRWPVPKGKDPGDYLKDHAGDLREWIIAGLRKYCPGLAMERKAEQPETLPQLQKLNEPVREETKAVSGPSHISGISAFGRRYHIVSSLEGARILEKSCPGEVVLTTDELKSMEGMNPEEADKILAVLEAFPGARVREVRKINQGKNPN